MCSNQAHPTLSFTYIHSSSDLPSSKLWPIPVSKLAHAHHDMSLNVIPKTFSQPATGTVLKDTKRGHSQAAGTEVSLVCSRSLGSSAPLMEEILRWGTQDLFQARHDSEDGRTAVQSGEGEGGATPMEGMEGQGALPGDGGGSAKVGNRFIDRSSYSVE